MQLEMHCLILIPFVSSPPIVILKATPLLKCQAVKVGEQFRNTPRILNSLHFVI